MEEVEGSGGKWREVEAIRFFGVGFVFVMISGQSVVGLGWLSWEVCRLCGTLDVFGLGKGCVGWMDIWEYMGCKGKVLVS